MNKKSIHVLPNQGNWSVQTSGSKKAYRTTSTQKEAIDIAKQVAKTNKSELLIHGKNGQIREKNSYGNDPIKIKG